MAHFNTARYSSVIGITALLLLGTISSAMAADVTLEINNVESAEGNLRIAIYDQEARFDKGLPYKTISQPAVTGKIEIELSDLPVGQYGVMLFQDINGNEKLDRSLVGRPTEPWSASLQGRSIIGAPGWYDIRFKVPAEGNRIVIDMR